MDIDLARYHHGSPLLESKQEGVAKILLERGADLDFITETTINKGDMLFQATTDRRPDIVEILLHKGAQPCDQSSTFNQRTPSWALDLDGGREDQFDTQLVRYNPLFQMRIEYTIWNQMNDVQNQTGVYYVKSRYEADHTLTDTDVIQYTNKHSISILLFIFATPHPHNHTSTSTSTSTSYSYPTNKMPQSSSSSSSEGVTGAAKFVTSTLGNTVGGLSRTVGGVTGTAARGVGDTITKTTGDAGKPVGNAIGSAGTGIENGVGNVAKGVEDAGQWK